MQTNRAIRQWLEGQLPGWEAAGWLTPAGVRGLRRLVDPGEPGPDRAHRLFTAISILGAALLGGGVILLFAYNWNGLGRGTRAVLSFVPLLLAQVATLFALWRRPASPAWREGSSAGLVTSLAAAIALIGQTYQIQGNLSHFLLTWMLLTAPLVLLLRSVLAAFSLWIQFLFWMGQSRLIADEVTLGWLILAGLAVCTTWHQIETKRERPLLNLLAFVAATLLLLFGGQRETWHSWLLLLTPWCAIWVAMAGLAPSLRSAVTVAGVVKGGLLLLFLASTYDEFWQYRPAAHALADVPLTEWLLAGALYLAWAGLLVLRWRALQLSGRLLLLAPLLAVSGWTLAIYGNGAAVALALNILALLLGLALILESQKSGDRGGFRSGLLLIGATLALRFFDADLGILARGIAFIILGAAFLGLNFWLSRRPGREDGQ